MAKRVLLADDTESVRIIVRDALEGGAAFDSTGDPREAVRMAEEGDYDVIFVDLSWDIPGLTMTERVEVGYKLLENVVGLAPEVYLYTNHTFRQYMDRALELGAKGVIDKNDIDRLREIVYG